MKYSKTPLKVRQNLSFLINVAKLENCEDIKSDMNGVFYDTCICTWTVEVSKENDVDTLEKKKIDLVSKKSYHVYINSMRNKAGLSFYIFCYEVEKERFTIQFVCCSTRLQEKVATKLYMKYLLMETGRERESHYIPARKVHCKPLKITIERLLPNTMFRKRQQGRKGARTITRIDQQGVWHNQAQVIPWKQPAPHCTRRFTTMKICLN